MEDIKNKVKIDINDIAMGVYGFLMKKKLITPDEYHILRGNRILNEEAKEEENNDNENE